MKVPLRRTALWLSWCLLSSAIAGEKISFHLSHRKHQDGIFWDEDYIINGRGPAPLHVERWRPHFSWNKGGFVFPVRIIRRITPATSVTRRSYEGKSGRMTFGGCLKATMALHFYRSSDSEELKFDGELTTEKASDTCGKTDFSLQGQSVLVSPVDWPQKSSVFRTSIISLDTLSRRLEKAGGKVFREWDHGFDFMHPDIPWWKGQTDPDRWREMPDADESMWIPQQRVVALAVLPDCSKGSYV